MANFNSAFATVDAVQALIRSITFENVSSNPMSLTNRSITFTVYDGDGGKSNLVTRDVSITPYNDPPVLANLEAIPLNFTENDPPLTVTATITVSDLDNTNVVSATIRISTNYQNGADVLGDDGSVPIGITVNPFDAGTGTLTLTGARPLAEYQTALRAITFVNTSENPSGLARSISFRVGDGASPSNTVTRTVNVIPVIDNPELGK